MAKLLITGARGIVGTGLRPLLSQRHELRLSIRNHREGEDYGSHEVIVGDICEPEVIDRAVAGCDAIIHLAASYGLSIPFEETVAVNYRGLVALMEAAVRHGVRNVIFASSNHGWGFYPRTAAPLPDTAPPRPDGWYGVSKIFGEAVMAYYGDAHGMTTTSLRIGNSDTAVPDERRRHMWISFTDLAQLVELSLARHDGGHRAVYATADCPDPFFDNASAKDMGFVPMDRPDDHLASPDVASQPPASGIAGLAIGGGYAEANLQIAIEQWEKQK